MIEDPTTVPAFLRPNQPSEPWVASLYKKYQLGDSPSLKQLEETATSLLSSMKTALTGAELVLNRRVDARDEDVGPIIATPGFSGAERFGLLMMQKEIEESPSYQAEKAKRKSASQK